MLIQWEFSVCHASAMLRCANVRKKRLNWDQWDWASAMYNLSDKSSYWTSFTLDVERDQVRLRRYRLRTVSRSTLRSLPPRVRYLATTCHSSSSSSSTVMSTSWPAIATVIQDLVEYWNTIQRSLLTARRKRLQCTLYNIVHSLLHAV